MSSIAILISSLVIGSIVGWLASSLVKVDARLEILLGAGVVGSILGVGVAYAMDFGPYGPLGSMIVCIVGASLLIAVLESLGVFAKVTSAR